MVLAVPSGQGDALPEEGVPTSIPLPSPEHRGHLLEGLLGLSSRGHHLGPSVDGEDGGLWGLPGSIALVLPASLEPTRPG